MAFHRRGGQVAAVSISPRTVNDGAGDVSEVPSTCRVPMPMPRSSRARGPATSHRRGPRRLRSPRTGNGSYVTSTASAASSAAPRVVATTTATGSPTNSATPSANAKGASRSGMMWISCRRSCGISAGGEYREHPGDSRGGRTIDGDDPRVRVRRADEDQFGHAGYRQVRGEAGLAVHQRSDDVAGRSPATARLLTTPATYPPPPLAFDTCIHVSNANRRVRV